MRAAGDPTFGNRTIAGPQSDNLQYTGDRTFYQGTAAALSGVLRAMCSAVTNASGQAQCSITVSQPLG
jgi:hypothetical protein